MNEEKRIIQVRGTGQASQPPDQVTITLDLASEDKEYGKAMQSGAKQVGALHTAIRKVGFDEDDLKTIDFSVESKNENESYKVGRSTRYRTVFVGFEISQKLKLTFDFEMEKLRKALDAIAESISETNLDIRFEVKEAGSFKNKLLETAAKDARKKRKFYARLQV